MINMGVCDRHSYLGITRVTSPNAISFWSSVCGCDVSAVAPSIVVGAAGFATALPPELPDRNRASDRGREKPERVRRKVGIPVGVGRKAGDLPLRFRLSSLSTGTISSAASYFPLRSRRMDDYNGRLNVLALMGVAVLFSVVAIGVIGRENGPIGVVKTASIVAPAMAQVK